MIVSLSVHKNTLRQHKAKVLKNSMRADTKVMSASDLNGYAIVTWNKEGRCNVAWRLGDTDPLAMPDKVRNAIIRMQTRQDIQDR